MTLERTLLTAPDAQETRPVPRCARCGEPKTANAAGHHYRCIPCDRIRRQEYRDDVRVRFRGEREGPSGQQTEQTRARFAELFRRHGTEAIERLASLLRHQQE